MHIGTMVEFAFALVAKLDAINKHSFNDFKLRVGMLCREMWPVGAGEAWCEGPACVLRAKRLNLLGGGRLREVRSL